MVGNVAALANAYMSRALPPPPMPRLNQESTETVFEIVVTGTTSRMAASDLLEAVNFGRETFETFVGNQIYRFVFSVRDLLCPEYLDTNVRSSSVDPGSPLMLTRG